MVWPAVLLEIVKGSEGAEGGGVGRRHHDGKGEAKEAYSKGDSGED